MHGKATLFGDEDVADQILKTDDPRAIKSLGRKVRGFHEKQWKKQREMIVYRNNVAKFTQNELLMEALLATRGLLVEASPSDQIWGIGMHENDAKRVPEEKWKGLNLLGKILTRVREEIRMNKNSLPEDNIDNESPSPEPKAVQGTKIAYLVRHGQSEGQVANRRERKNSSALRDCDLTRKGRKEADSVSLMMLREDFESIELVVSSPLTRALHTSLLAFSKVDLIVNYDLGELGSRIPENNPRPIDIVLKDLAQPLSYRDGALLLDTASLQPAGWPEPSLAKDRVRSAFKWLAQERNESVIAVVCHYNIIREAVKDGHSLNPVNATPIRCRLYPSGDLILA